MKTIVNIFLAILFIVFALDGFGQVYCTNSAIVTRTDRRTNVLTFQPTDGAAVTVTPLQSPTGDQNVYWDKTATIISVYPNTKLTITTSPAISWMHSYLYIDWNNDHTFSTDGAFTGTPDKDLAFDKGVSDLISFSYYGGINSENVKTANAIGTLLPNNGINIPRDAVPGDYRLRFVIQWGSIEPCGASTIGIDGGIIVDVTLRVVPSTPVVRTLPVTDVTSTEVTLNGSYDRFINPTATEVGFKYRRIGETAWKSERLSTTATPFTYKLSGLLPEINYEYHAYAMDGSDLHNGTSIPFMSRSTYCSPAVSKGNYVVLNNLKTLPTSTGLLAPLNYTPALPNGYEDFFHKVLTATESGMKVLQGGVLEMQIDYGNACWGGIAFYVDLNGSGTFEPSEMIYGGKGSCGTNPILPYVGTPTVTANISASAPPGIYRMRMTNAEGTTDACAGVSKVYDVQFEILRAFSVELFTNVGGTVAGGGVVSVDSLTTVTAFPDFGTYKFKHWSSDAKGADVISTNNPYTFTVTANTTLYANFEENTDPVVSTDSVANITMNSATIYGQYANITTPSEIGFEYKLSSVADWTGASKVTAIDISSPFSVTLSGLLQGKSYTVRAYAIDGANTIYGTAIPFTARFTTVHMTQLGSGALDGTLWEDAAPFSTLTTQLGKAGIEEVRLEGGKYALAATLAIPAGVKLSGSWNPTTNIQEKATAGTFTNAIYPFDFAHPTVLDTAAGFTTGYMLNVSGKIDGITIQNGKNGGVQVMASNVEITRSSILNNKQPNGLKRAAGIYLRGAGDMATKDTKIDGCLIAGNKITGVAVNEYTADVAGGIGNTTYGGESTAASTVAITHSVIANNFSINGTGGISITGRASGANSSIKNSLIINNETNASTCKENGRVAGGISTYQDVTNPTLEVINSTIAYNKSTLAASGDRGIGGATGVKLVNSAVYGNMAGAVASETGTLISGSTNNYTTDPLFVKPSTVAGNQVQWNDADYLLQPGSLCIDAGTEAGAPATDIIGKGRPLGVTYDIGAYEYTPKIHTVTIATEDDGQGAIAFTSPSGATGTTYTGYEVVTILATPNTANGYYFVAWKDATADTVVSAVNPYVYRGDIDVTLTAYFDNRYPFKYTDPAQGTIAVTVADTAVNNNDSIPFGTAFKATMTPSLDGYRLLRWHYETANTDAQYAGIFNNANTLTATLTNKYKVNYELFSTTSASGSITATIVGGSTAIANEDSVVYNTSLQLKYTPDDKDDYFQRWTNNLTADEPTTMEIIVPITQDVSYTAHADKVYEVQFTSTIITGATGHVTLTVMNGELPVSSGDKVIYKTPLTLKVRSDNPLDYVTQYRVNGITYNNIDPANYDFTITVVNSLNVLDEIIFENGIKINFVQPQGATIAIQNITAGLPVASGGSVNLNDQVSITVTPDEGYYITSFKINDEEQTGMEVTRTVTESLMVDVTTSNLRKVTFTTSVGGTLTVEDYINGTPIISGDNAIIGSTLKINALPQNGYTLSSLKVANVEKIEEVVDGLYLYPLPNEDLTIEAAFSPMMYQVSYLVLGGDERIQLKLWQGETEINNEGTVPYNTAITLEIIAPPAALLSSILVNEEERVADVTNNTLALTVTEDMILLLSFNEIPTYKVNFPVPENGTIMVMNGTNAVTNGADVTEGTTLSITATPNEGYQLSKLLVNEVDRLAEMKERVLTDVVNNTYNITVEFTKTPPTGILPDFAQDITLSPVPFTTTLTLNGLPSPVEITLFNVTGTKVGQYHAEHEMLVINTDRLSQGLYWVEITHNEESVVYKVLKQ